MLARRLLRSRSRVSLPAGGRKLALGTLALVLLLSGAALARSVSLLPPWVRAFGWDIENISSQQVRVALWLSEHSGPGCHVATHDVGAIGVLSGCRVTDLIGLMTPAMARLYQEYPRPADRDPRIRSLLVETGVRDPALQPVFSASLHHETVAGSRHMTVYTTPGEAPW